MNYVRVLLATILIFFFSQAIIGMANQKDEINKHKQAIYQCCEQLLLPHDVNGVKTVLENTPNQLHAINHARWVIKNLSPDREKKDTEHFVWRCAWSGISWFSPVLVCYGGLLAAYYGCFELTPAIVCSSAAAGLAIGGLGIGTLEHGHERYLAARKAFEQCKTEAYAHLDQIEHSILESNGKMDLLQIKMAIHKRSKSL